jgi:hypothetical protein
MQARRGGNTAAQRDHRPARDRARTMPNVPSPRTDSSTRSSWVWRDTLTWCSACTVAAARSNCCRCCAACTRRWRASPESQRSLLAARRRKRASPAGDARAGRSCDCGRGRGAGLPLRAAAAAAPALLSRTGAEVGAALGSVLALARVLASCMVRMAQMPPATALLLGRSGGATVSSCCCCSLLLPLPLPLPLPQRRPGHPPRAGEAAAPAGSRRLSAAPAGPRPLLRRARAAQSALPTASPTAASPPSAPPTMAAASRPWDGLRLPAGQEAPAPDGTLKTVAAYM